MAKRKNILDRTIALVDKKKTKAEEEFCNFSDVSSELSLINRVFPEDFSYDSLGNISLDDFNLILKQVYNASEDDIVNVLKGAYYVIKNDIPLFDSQIVKLKDFVDRVHGLKKKLSSSSNRFNALVAKIKDYEELEKELSIAKSEGIIGIDLIDRVSTVLDMDEKDKNSFLYETMEFNLGNYKTLSLEIIVEDKKSIIDIDDLRKIFSKYGYDLSSLDDRYIKSLQEEGNLENIEGVFKAITENKMSFLQEKRKAKLLTQFLLFSNENIINEVCSKFKENYVSSSFFTSYLPIFFPSEDKKTIKRGKRKKITDVKTKKNLDDVEVKDDLTVKGLHKDFFKNLEYMTNNFNVDEKTLLERGIRLLTLTHDSLIKHIEELELYGYDIHNEKFPLSAIAASRIMDSTDSFIEIGEERYIKRYASRLLFTCSDIAKRIYAYKESGLEYHSEGRSGTIKTDVVNLSTNCELTEATIEKLVPDDVEELLRDNKCKELLDSYSPRKISDSTLKDPVIVNLDERFMTSDSTYRIDDIVISRRKVLRNYEFLTNNMGLIPENERDVRKMLLVSVINNSLLHAGEIEVIDNNIKSVLAYSGGSHGISKK